MIQNLTSKEVKAMNRAGPLERVQTGQAQYEPFPNREHSCTRASSPKPSRSDCSIGCVKKPKLAFELWNGPELDTNPQPQVRPGLLVHWHMPLVQKRSVNGSLQANPTGRTCVVSRAGGSEALFYCNDRSIKLEVGTILRGTIQFIKVTIISSNPDLLSKLYCLLR